jgi:hypothetical protein
MAFSEKPNFTVSLTAEIPVLPKTSQSAQTVENSHK